MSVALAVRTVIARERSLSAALSAQKRQNPEDAHLALAM
jgi:hypothetical protein